jgi:hypothetical protein
MKRRSCNVRRGFVIAVTKASCLLRYNALYSGGSLLIVHRVFLTHYQGLFGTPMMQAADGSFEASVRLRKATQRHTT